MIIMFIITALICLVVGYMIMGVSSLKNAPQYWPYGFVVSFVGILCAIYAAHANGVKVGIEYQKAEPVYVISQDSITNDTIVNF